MRALRPHIFFKVDSEQRSERLSSPNSLTGLQIAFLDLHAWWLLSETIAAWVNLSGFGVVAVYRDL